MRQEQEEAARLQLELSKKEKDEHLETLHQQQTAIRKEEEAKQSLDVAKTLLNEGELRLQESLKSKNLVGIEVAVEYIGVAKRRLEEFQNAVMHLSSKKQDF